jgi:hypothetical protein
MRLGSALRFRNPGRGGHFASFMAFFRMLSVLVTRSMVPLYQF